MSADFEMFNYFIKKFVALTEEELADLNHKCQVVEFAKGDIIIKSGEYHDNFYFLIKGIVMYYKDNENGHSRIYNFRTENMALAGYGPYNYHNNFKSVMDVKCIEDSVMIQVPLKVLNYVVENYKSGERLGRFMAETHVIELVNYILTRDFKSIDERLDNIDNIFPNIQQRIPQYMIASYLGITPVHLSNLKKRRNSFKRTLKKTAQ